MATFNGSKYLVEQIESILSQKTTFEFDLIIRDDGSTDGTLEILKKYEHEGKIVLLEGNNIGAARGFISLLKETAGYDFYAFSDQDDVWNRDKLQNGVDAIKEIKGPALYCSNCELVNADLDPIGRNTHRSIPTYTLESILCLACCAQGCTSIFNNKLAKIIQDTSIPDVFIMHDSLLTCLCGLIDGKIIYDEKPSMKYRMHGGNVFGMVSARQSPANVIKGRLLEISKKKEISMYDQSASLLKTYKKYIPVKNQNICCVVIKSKDSIRARLKLIFNSNLKHDTLNMTITKKIEILFGNG